MATNLAIDTLRRRRMEQYVGPWLPTAVESPAGEAEAEARYGLRESATAAFLFAVEVLSPVQRAALVLRDVLGYTGPETARILETTPENVRVMLFRARRSMAGYDAERCQPGVGADETTTAAMTRLFAALMRGDVDEVRACLTADAIVVSDAGGRLRAATKVVSGVDHAAALLISLAQRSAGRMLSSTPVRVNGLPAVLVRLAEATPRDARVLLVQADVDGDGMIRRVFTWIAPEKLGRLG